jgi:GNAT superfamily N-acetyltransferase
VSPKQEDKTERRPPQSLSPALSQRERELFTRQHDDYLISTDTSRLDLKLIHDFLSNHTYWATGRSLEVVQRSIENSLPFGIYKGKDQVGFARIVTDYATFAWIADVFVLPEQRGQGLSKWLMEVVLSHPRLQGFRRWVLSTKDAHGVYERFGFRKLHRPERWMERPDPNMQESPDYWQTNDAKQ